MSLEINMNLQDYIIDVPDWPKEGIVFKDIIVGCEARGFIFGSYLAKRMGAGFIPVRKKGKLPPPVISKDYELEYGTDTLEIKPGDGERVIIVDDVYATGGTAKATRELCKEAGYEVVDEVYLINLSFLNKDKVKSFTEITNYFDEFKSNHETFTEKGNKAAGGRARKAIGEIKKLVTEYRKESVASTK